MRTMNAIKSLLDVFKELAIDLYRLLIVKRDWVSNLAAALLGLVVGTIMLLIWTAGGF